VTGARQEHIIAFARRHNSSIAVTIAPRLAYTLMKVEPGNSFAQAWGDTQVALPASSSRLENIFTGETAQPENAVFCRDIFCRFPVALLGAG
jgi:(1->4)-alpha-D-glucan 1-alpha-D-glucosylmutase